MGAIGIEISKRRMSREPKILRISKIFQEILVLYCNLQEPLGYFDIQTGSKLLRTLVFSPAEVWMKLCQLNYLVGGLKFRARVGETLGRRGPVLVF